MPTNYADPQTPFYKRVQAFLDENPMATMGLATSLLDASQSPNRSGASQLSAAFKGFGAGTEMDRQRKLQMQEQQFYQQAMPGVPQGLASQVLADRMKQEGQFTNVPPGNVLFRGTEQMFTNPASRETNTRIAPKRLPNGMIQDMVVDEGGREVRPYGAPYKPDSRSDASGMRKEYTALSKTFIEVRDAYARVTQAAKKPSPAGDLALLFNYMKMLDPDSVVRESEFAEAAKAGSFGDRMQAAVGRVVSGEKLTDDQRDDFVDRAKMLFEAQQNSQRRLEREFSRISSGTGYDPSDVIVDFDNTGSPEDIITLGGKKYRRLGPGNYEEVP